MFYYILPFLVCNYSGLADVLSAHERSELVRNSREYYIDQKVDHFTFDSRVYRQRFFVNNHSYIAGGPVFFYTGNENKVEMYMTHTGLMWENAKDFGALIVFAEHRYYGNSLPFSQCNKENMQYLQAEQAMADYATLIDHITHRYSTEENTPVIVFGGSYGGMLAAWMRMRYPQLVTGAIAASAPIFSLIGLNPRPDEYIFNRIVSDDAGHVCSSLIRRGLQYMEILSQSENGLKELSSAFMTCKSIDSREEAMGLLAWFTDPWANLAMGDYPYPSDYMIDATTNITSKLPAYPVSAACVPLNEGGIDADNVTLLDSMRRSAAIWYNLTGDAACFYNEGRATPSEVASRNSLSYTAVVGRHKHGKRSEKSGTCGDWDYQYCAEFMMPFSAGSDKDFFWPPTKFNLTDSQVRCKEKWGIEPNILEPILRYGDYSAVAIASNIFFSNGDLDPWTGWGVDCTKTKCGADVKSAVIKGGAHHLDLMFSNEDDPESVRNVRKLEVDAIRVWVQTRIVSQQAESSITAVVI